jgi:hypothetical protein
MYNFVMPALTAIGINSGMNLLRRKPLFENAGTAAVTGGVLGGFNGGGLFSSSPTAGLTDAASKVSGNVPSSLSGSSVLSGATSANAVPGSAAFWQGANTAGVGNGLNVSNAMGGIPGAGAFEASMGLDKAYNAGAAAGLPGSGTIESVMGPANAAGTYLDKDYFANVLGSPVYTGNEGLLSQIGTGAESLFDTAKANLPDITPQNLIGVSSILSNMANAPRPVANMGGNQISGTPPKFEPFQTGQVYTRKRGNR